MVKNALKDGETYLQDDTLILSTTPPKETITPTVNNDASAVDTVKLKSRKQILELDSQDAAHNQSSNIDTGKIALQINSQGCSRVFIVKSMYAYIHIHVHNIYLYFL